MAEYHYKYDPPRRDQNQNQANADDLAGWIVIIIALAVFWPLGLFLLFRKLMSASTTSSRSNRRPATRTSQTGSTYHYTYTYNPNQARQTRQAKQAAPAAQSAPAAASSTPAAPATPAQPTVRKLAGGGFITGGSIMTGLFGFCLLVTLADAIGSGAYAVADSLGGLLAMACFTGIGLVLLYVGLFRRKRSKMFRKYQALIGRRESVNISTLVNATGRSYKKVCDELQDMLDFGVLPMGYLDLANDKLVLTSQGITDQPQAETPAEEKSDDDTILAQIKMVNDAIPDPVMSAKIDRIGVLTGKILDYQRKNPDKDSQLRSFLNYYLPTTLKILRAYAQLDQQGIEGENISAAKARIEGMMDKVVEGFEKQLDKLFRDEALDITSDVSVLEKMLDKDGLGQSGMTLEL